MMIGHRMLVQREPRGAQRVEETLRIADGRHRVNARAAKARQRAQRRAARHRTRIAGTHVHDEMRALHEARQ